MRVNTSHNAAPLAPVRAPQPAAEATGAAEATPAALQSGVLGPAMQALREMPEIDEARVAQLREAYQRGELRFDAGKLAALIQRYHGEGR
ncbi:flagellar biosynthesis anti-sigma factor FlgM [Hydrogenophaga sp. YM1]|uniref:flagellar biosynthesis anti-sigma factor FlgM n=1 Tax=Hydrogenophaga sp. YM1 TaxID=2806262 RepID=UPI0019571177|nr:flagellar biosynthesis anti-sigma factor FlgM [Hydrogenophaga sp. YM1]QRR33615.1 flagellar biosynthesis anti-sigma factor FlgM [Hydrogenophaga sp. YM1]